ncbi:MAG: protein kinase [Deltaproteobacteria bacterium]|nr:protein kinase [Deltaproteobacteria bacterium]
MTCPHCRAPITADARFCGACGKATAPTESDPSIPLAQVAELAGKEIAGRYRILTKLGEGGMGAVYRGEQISLRRAVAVKLLRPELSANPTLLRRFSAEAEAVAKLSHPNTVNVYDFGQDTDGALFIAMEYIEGRSLRAVVAKEGPLPPARALAIAVQVAASLADAHAHNIVHRDLKPDNVMLQDRGRQRDVVRVLDFGIAKLRDDSRATQQAMTQQGDMLGTPQYMAPEQIKGDPVDGRVDIYALGCMLYEMVTARLPFEAPTIMAMLSKHLIETPVPPSQRRPDLAIPPAIDQLVIAAMAKDPAQRPASMDTYGEQLAAVLAKMPSAPLSAQVSVQQPVASTPTPAVQPIVTPAAYSVASSQGAAPLAAPTPAAYVPPAIPPTTRVPDRASAAAIAAPPSTNAQTKSRTPLFLALAVLLAAGGGIAAYFVTLDKHTDGQGSASPAPTPTPTLAPPTPSNAPDPWNGATATRGPDPWAGEAEPNTEPDVGTFETPVPPGLELHVPSTWKLIHPDAKSFGYLDSTRGVFVGVGPLFPGSNDPKVQAKDWSKTTGARLRGTSKVMSAGELRDAMAFTSKVNNVEVGQVIVLYPEPAYRIGIIYQAPITLFGNQQFLAEMTAFYANSVELP